MRIPSSIKSSDIQRAIQHIDKQVPRFPRKRASIVYDLHYRRKLYPPKYLLSLANRFANGSELWGFKGGPQTNNFLIARGFSDIRNKKTGNRIQIIAEDEDDAALYPEGKEAFGWHRKLERNPKLARKVKNLRLKESGDLRCEVCGFSFHKYYGPIGIGFIEAHHTVPVSQFKGQRITRPEEIGLVCSNCHRMLHRVPPLLSIADLRKRLKVKTW
jgi:hypothetical protein